MQSSSNRPLHAGLMVLCGFMLAHIIGVDPTRAESAPDRRPNIVFILTDDEDLRLQRYMPKTQELLKSKGTYFENYFVTYSWCCPSRATSLRGQYAHNHGVLGNDLPAGGFKKFRALGHESSTIATWLSAAGYRTALVGKYLNHYDPEQDAVPPGWDDWYVPAATIYSYFDYVLNENGKAVSYGQREQDYIDDVLARHAVSVIEHAAAANEPLFLYVAPYAPHAPATGAPRHAHLFEDEPFVAPASFDERDVSDKPSIIRDLPPLQTWQRDAIERHNRERIRSMQTVDEMVERIVTTLEATGELDNTYIVYASDNGWHMGEHRMFVGKTTAYEEDIHVPMIVRGPGIPAGERIEALVINNDLAPTFAAIAGVATPSFVDGRSFLPLFDDARRPWRKSFAIERRQRETHELTGAAVFNAIRTADWTYVEYGTGERELYALTSDPHQLANAVDETDPKLVAALSRRLAELVNCASTVCREIENLPVPPAVPAPAAPEPAPVAGAPVLQPASYQP